MAYTPKTSKEILQDLVAGVIARSELTDISEGSVVAQILSTVATELSSSEYRLARIRDSFSLSRISGQLLDERIAEFPQGSIVRLPAAASRGTVLTITRLEETDGAGLPNEVVVPIGSTVGRTDDATIIYATTEPVVFPPSNEASQSIRNVSIVCLTPGIDGNCASSTINKIIGMPTFVSSIEQTSPILGGQEAESDLALRNRAILYLSSLARCQPTALEYFALSFVASDRTRARYAAVYEDTERRGYSELVIDDGSVIIQGQEVATRPGRPIEGQVPGLGEGILTIFHEAPAFSPIKKIQRFDANGVEQPPLRPDVFVSLPERGIVYVDGGVFSEGESYRIGPIQNDADAGYSVFTGKLIPEMQRAIEGDLNDPIGLPGLRAAGTRVRVLPPLIEGVDFDMQIIPVSGVSFVDTADEVREAAVEFVLTLRPGDPLFVSQLIDRVMNNRNLIDVKFFEHDTVNPGTTPMQDRYPRDTRSVFRPDPDAILVIPPEDFE